MISSWKARPLDSELVHLVVHHLQLLFHVVNHLQIPPPHCGTDRRWVKKVEKMKKIRRVEDGKSEVSSKVEEKNCCLETRNLNRQVVGCFEHSTHSSYQPCYYVLQIENTIPKPA